jgi:hypothetical protein
VRCESDEAEGRPGLDKDLKLQFRTCGESEVFQVDLMENEGNVRLTRWLNAESVAQAWVYAIIRCEG